MTSPENTKPKQRVYYFDNLRIYLTVLVIFHHAALAFGGMGDWGVKDPAVDDISPIFLLFFNAINQTYFMSAFFLLAGYFTPPAFERKGSILLLKDRLIRLGIPLAIYTTVIVNVTNYMLTVYHKGASYGIRNLEFVYNPGHLWFLQALLIFALIYVIFRVLADRSPQKGAIKIYRDTFPPDVALWISIGVLAVLTFSVRVVFPIGVWFAYIQPGHFVHYAFSFYGGVLAYRGDWFHRLPKIQARRWGIMSLIIIPFFFVMLILGGVLENEEVVEKFLGGFHLHAFVYSVWETFLFIGIIVFLLYFFRERLNRSGKIAKSMAVNVYTAYIIHQTILYALDIIMIPVNIPTILKFFVVGLLGVTASFLISIPIRRLPYAQRVLG